MKQTRIIAIGCGGIIFLFAATTSMLGIADAAHTGKKSTPISTSSTKVMRYSHEPLSLTHSYKAQPHSSDNDKTPRSKKATLHMPSKDKKSTSEFLKRYERKNIKRVGGYSHTKKHTQDRTMSAPWSPKKHR